MYCNLDCRVIVIVSLVSNLCIRSSWYCRGSTAITWTSIQWLTRKSTSSQAGLCGVVGKTRGQKLLSEESWVLRHFFRTWNKIDQSCNVQPQLLLSNSTQGTDGPCPSLGPSWLQLWLPYFQVELAPLPFRWKFQAHQYPNHQIFRKRCQVQSAAPLNLKRAYLTHSQSRSHWPPLHFTLKLRLLRPRNSSATCVRRGSKSGSADLCGPFLTHQVAEVSFLFMRTASWHGFLRKGWREKRWSRWVSTNTSPALARPKFWSGAWTFWATSSSLRTPRRTDLTLEFPWTRKQAGTDANFVEVNLGW